MTARYLIYLIAAAMVVAIAPRPALADTDHDTCFGEAGDKALAACTRLIDQNMRDPRPFAQRALNWRKKGNFDYAIADYTEAIKYNSTSTAPHNERGEVLILRNGKGDRYRAFNDFTVAIQSNSTSALPRINRGKEQMESTVRRDQALFDFSEAIRLDPTSAIAYHYRGLVWLFLFFDTDKAIADLNEAISIDPTLATADLRKYARSGVTRIDMSSRIARVEAKLLSVAQVAKPKELPSSTLTVKPMAGKPQSQLQEADQAASIMPKDRRIALVIGNSRYNNAPLLPNPQRDATMVADTLKRTGFAEVTLQTDLSREALATALQKFARSADTADWAVVYYAGHGMEIGGINYLIPVDATLETDRDVQFQAVPLNQVLDVVASASKLRLVVLDACRSNPFANSMKRQIATRAVERGFVRIDPNPGTLVVYAAKDGEVASDGNGSNSPFSLAFAKNIQMPGIDITKVFRLVYDDVMEATANKQSPYTYGALSGRQDFYFVDPK